MTELVELIGAVAGNRLRIGYRDSSAAGNLVGDNAAMKDVLGVLPQIALRDGLQEVVEQLSVAAA